MQGSVGAVDRASGMENGCGRDRVGSALRLWVRTTEEALPSGSQASTSGAHWDGQFSVVMGASLVDPGAAMRATRTIRGRSSSEGKRTENWADEAGPDREIGEGVDEEGVHVRVK